MIIEPSIARTMFVRVLLTMDRIIWNL